MKKRMALVLVLLGLTCSVTGLMISCEGAKTTSKSSTIPLSCLTRGEQNCSGDGLCAFDTNVGRCRTVCASVTSQSDCQAATNDCTWTGTFCQQQTSANCPILNNRVDCLSYAQVCTWNGFSCNFTYAGSACTQYTTGEACMGNSQICRWTGTACTAVTATACSPHLSESACSVQSAICRWDNSQGRCLLLNSQTCSSITDQVTCSGTYATSCYWDTVNNNRCLNL